ncbi:MAG TPA: cyclic nucleotide-binding domain-containing protein [Actinomycetota bacterium]|nr:cyclic nucleotide-binding domain-containing protein [Actinomycetota bacterium]
MAINDVVEHLAVVPIFDGCSKKDLQTVARQVREISHDAGYVVATEGDPGAGLFVIAEGEADVSIGGKKVNHLKAGDFFGEMALLDGGPRTATVTSTTPIKLYALTEWVFRGLLVEHPTIAMRTLETMAARLRGATKLATA